MILNEILFEELDDCEECKEELKEATHSGPNKWLITTAGEMAGAADDIINIVSEATGNFADAKFDVPFEITLDFNSKGKPILTLGFTPGKKPIQECDKQDQELTEKAWKIQVPEETARNFRDALEAEDLAGAAKELQGILDFLENELGDDAAYEIDDIRSALAGIDLDRDPDDTVSWADDDDEDYTVGDDFDDNVLTPLWDLLDEHDVWMPL